MHSWFHLDYVLPKKLYYTIGKDEYNYSDFFGIHPLMFGLGGKDVTQTKLFGDDYTKGYVVKFTNCINELPENIFAGRGLTNIKLPYLLKKINNGAFKNNRYLKNIEIPDTVTEIGKEVFSGCERLETVKLPVNLNYIEDDCFTGCTSLKEINLPKNVQQIGRRSFYNCRNLKKGGILKIPENCMVIFSEAFYQCKFTMLELPASIKIIDDNAFAGSELVSITIKSRIPPKIGRGSFPYKLNTIYVPKESYDTYIKD